MLRKIQFGMAIGLIVCLVAQSEEPQTFDEAYAAVKSNASLITSWTADVEGVSNLSGEPTIRIDRRYGKGDRFRIELRDAGDTSQLVVLDANQIEWMENRISDRTLITKNNLKKMRKLMEKDMRDLKLSSTRSINISEASMWYHPLTILDSQSFDYAMTFVGIKVEEIAIFVFEGELKYESTLDTESRIRLSIGAEDGFLRRYETFTSDGSPIRSIRFTNIKFNPELDDALFVYTPPKGIKVNKL